MTGRDRGFTIVELLIVVVVIAILAAITIVAYNGISIRASDSATLVETGQLIKKLESVKVVDGAYPAAIPATNSSLISQHNEGAWMANMNFVVNRPNMQTLEIQKLAAFEAATKIKLPPNTLYFSGTNSSDWKSQLAFVMTTFKDRNNIPESNRSFRLAASSNNNSYPQLLETTYGASCVNATVLKTAAQSNLVYGSHDLPFLDTDGTITMWGAVSYTGSALKGCSPEYDGTGGQGIFLRDRSSDSRGGTALYVLRRPVY